jgi:hypothetical protein
MGVWNFTVGFLPGSPVAVTPAILLSFVLESLELVDADEDAEDEELPEPHAAMPRHMPAAHSAVTRLAAA